MKLRDAPKFLGGVTQLEQWLNAMSAWLFELGNSLSRLSLLNNFEAFEVEVTIPNGAEVEVRNELRDVIPTRYIVTRTTNPGLCDGNTTWTRDFLYLRNAGAASLTAKVIFLR